MQAPDYPEALTGYRAFKLTANLKLCSPFRHHWAWEPGVNQARCQVIERTELLANQNTLAGSFSTLSYDPHPFKVFHEGARQDVPSPDCTCGLYAYTEKPSLDGYLKNRLLAFPAYGKVRGWGRIELYSEGYRAQYAQVERIALSPLFEEGIFKSRGGKILSAEKVGSRLTKLYQVPVVSYEEL